jgi:uncharacterized protein (DUF697 family)
MKLPVDLKEVMNAAADIDAAACMPVSVAVIVDPTVSQDLQDCVLAAFDTPVSRARVGLFAYAEPPVLLEAGTDLVVLVAGFSGYTGALAAYIREGGTPVLTVTSMPDIVSALASQKGHPLLDGDVIAPDPMIDGLALPAVDDFNQEPFPLTLEREQMLLNRMGRWVVDVFHEKRLAFSLCFPFVRRPLAVDSIEATSLQNTVIGAVTIIPGADMPVMTFNQAKMLLQIAAAYGQEMGIERLRELLPVVGGGFVCRTLARQLVSVVPGWGWAVKAGIGCTGTLAMGYAAIAYFEQTVGGGASLQEAAAYARAEAVRFAAAAGSQQASPAMLATAAGAIADDVAHGIGCLAAKVYPAVRSTVVGVCDATGTDPKELGRQLVGSLLAPSKKA